MILLLKPSVHSCQAWNKIQTPSPCRIWLLLSWLTSVHTTLPFTLHFAASLIFFQVFKYAKLIPASGPLHLQSPLPGPLFLMTFTWLALFHHVSVCPDIKFTERSSLTTLYKNLILSSHFLCSYLVYFLHST